MTHFPVIDLHCDSITSIQSSFSYENSPFLALDFELLKKQKLQVMAIFLDSNKVLDLWSQFLYYQHALLSLVNRYDHLFYLLKNPAEYKLYKYVNKTKIMIGVEGAEIIETHYKELSKYFISIVTITWNNKNRFASPHYLSGGLTKDGRSLVQSLNQQKIIIDISHMNEEGAIETIKLSNSPCIASHSNSQVCAYTTRNISLSTMLLLKASGGVIGLNFYPPFLSSTSPLEGLVNNIKLFRLFDCLDIICFGSDYDGFPNNLFPYSFEDVISYLLNHGVTENEILMIISENFEKYLERFLELS